MVVLSDLSIHEKLANVLSTVRDWINCDAATLFIINQKTGVLEEEVSIGGKVDLITSIDGGLGDEMKTWMAKQHRSVLIPDFHKEQDIQYRSVISTPLITGDKLIGFINLGAKKPNALNERHMKFLEIIAGQLAYTIERMNFEEELIQKNAALVNARSEIERQQNQILEMEKYQMLGEFASTINHEINNPLTTIIGNIELLLMTHSTDENLRKKLHTILHEAQRIANITEKISILKRSSLENIRKLRTDEDMIEDT
jgi:signal transduction histidine kinase